VKFLKEEGLDVYYYDNRFSPLSIKQGKCRPR
jgi:hypothetical protein